MLLVLCEPPCVLKTRSLDLLKEGDKYNQLQQQGIKLMGDNAEELVLFFMKSLVLLVIMNKAYPYINKILQQKENVKDHDELLIHKDRYENEEGQGVDFQAPT